MTNSRRDGRTAYHLCLFVVISVLCGLLVAGFGLPIAALLGGAAKRGANSLESLPAELAIGPQSERSRVLMADGSTLAEFYSENRVYVPLSKISKVMQSAQVAIEDDRFYSHGPIDFRGTARAALRSASGSTQGGSTLTQQYVKQVQIEAAVTAGDEAGIHRATEQSLSRKIRELRFAAAVEKKLSKEQILERYLNIAYYGDGAYGVEAAARHYFGVTAAQLDLAQSAMLAGLVQNPVATDPVHHLTGAMNRRTVVLNRMAQLGRITPAQAAAAKKVPFETRRVQQPRNGCVSSRFPTLCLYVTRVLTSDAFGSLGKTPDERLTTLKRGGLTIRTEINPTAQDSAEKAVARRVAATDPFISTAVLVQPRTGLIVSMAQNRTRIGTGPGETWFNYAVDSAHGGAEGYQAGSTFKAFTMAAALAKGLTPSTTYTAPGRMNYSDLTFASCQGRYRGPDAPVKNSTGHNGTMNMTSAAMWSVNTYFLKLEAAVGGCDTVKMTEAAGVKLASGAPMLKPGRGLTPYDSIPSFTLGVAEVTPLSMAEAYATFANRGVHCDPIIIKSITTKAGKDLAVPGANCRKVMEPAVADALSQILQKVITEGTALPAHLSDDRDQAGKTGTIDGAAAVWLAGYTPDMAGISMIAVDKQARQYKGRPNPSIMSFPSHGTDCGEGGCVLAGSGGQDAGKIWRVAMDAALRGVTPGSFHKPGQQVMQGKLVELPSLERKSADEAMAALQAAGASYEVVEGPSDSPRGTFLYAEPSSGRVRASDPVQLHVSSGVPAARPAKPAYHSTSRPRKRPTTRTSRPRRSTRTKARPGGGSTSRPTTSTRKHG